MVVVVVGRGRRGGEGRGGGRGGGGGADSLYDENVNP